MPPRQPSCPAVLPYLCLGSEGASSGQLIVHAATVVRVQRSVPHLKQRGSIEGAVGGGIKRVWMLVLISCHARVYVVVVCGCVSGGGRGGGVHLSVGELDDLPVAQTHGPGLGEGQAQVVLHQRL